MTLDLAALFVQILPTAVAGLVAWSWRRVTSEAKERDERLEKAIAELRDRVERLHELDLLGQRMAAAELEIARSRTRLHKVEGSVAVVVSRLQEKRPSGEWPRIDEPEEP